MQANKLVRELDNVEGHSVRAMYLYSAMVDLSIELSDEKVDGWEEILYSTEQPIYDHCNFTAIPYYAWANRQPGEMRVWIPELL